MADHPAYGPLCPVLASLYREVRAARGDLADCAEAGFDCQTLRTRLNQLDARMTDCEIRMLGLSHGLVLCCPDFDKNDALSHA